jgi:hypothetical protein
MGLPRRHCCQLAVLGVLLVTAAVGIRADPELDSSCAGQDYVQVSLRLVGCSGAFAGARLTPALLWSRCQQADEHQPHLFSRYQYSHLLFCHTRMGEIFRSDPRGPIPNFCSSTGATPEELP